MLKYPTLVIPGLFWLHEADNQYLLPQLDLLAFNQVLRNSSIELLPNRSIANWVYNVQSPYKTAMEVVSPDLFARYHNWLYIEPTHLRVDRDRLLISEPELLQLNEQEIELIINLINQHFAGDLYVAKFTDTLWLLGCDIDVSQIKTQPALNIVGENIDDYLPEGTNDLRLHSIMNEIQMLLFEHPLNLQRKEEQLLEVNSIWLWNNDFSMDIPINRVTDLTLEILTNNNGYIYLDSLLSPVQYRDSFAWINRFNQVGKVLSNLLQQLFKQSIQVEIIVPQLDNAYLLKVKKPHILNFLRKNSYQKYLSSITKV